MAPRTVTSIWDLPDVPAVYALYGRSAERERLLFVGVAESLFERLLEQLVIPSLHFRTPGAGMFMQPGYVGEVRWWEHERFASSEALRAAEFVASELLGPLFTSRRPSSPRARDLFAVDAFRAEMRSVFEGEPSGRALLPTLDELGRRLARIEERLGLAREPTAS
jgi:hypothetical protein